MARWTRVASLSQCPPGSATEWVADNRVIALYHVEGVLYALDGICPHQGGPLGKGRLEGAVVTCPWHGWQFCVATGQHQFSPSVVQPGFPARVEDGWIWVDLG